MSYTKSQTIIKKHIVDNYSFFECFELVEENFLSAKLEDKIKRLIAKEFVETTNEVDRRNWMIDEFGYEETIQLLGKEEK